MKPAISDPGRFALKNAVRAAIVVPFAFGLGLRGFGLPLGAPGGGRRLTSAP